MTWEWVVLLSVIITDLMAFWTILLIVSNKGDNGGDSDN